MRKEVDPRTMLDDDEVTTDETDQDIITVHVTIITRDGTKVINTDTMTLVLVGMIDDEEEEETRCETIDHTKTVATLTGVVADILNLTNTNVQIVMTDTDVGVDPDPDLHPKKNVRLHATVLVQSQKRRSPRM